MKLPTRPQIIASSAPELPQPPRASCSNELVFHWKQWLTCVCILNTEPAQTRGKGLTSHDHLLCVRHVLGSLYRRTLGIRRTALHSR